MMAGRPFVGDVDLPAFAVVPWGKSCFALEAVYDMRRFITAEPDREFAPVLSPGWMKQLVFVAEVAQATALHRQLLAATAHRRN